MASPTVPATIGRRRIDAVPALAAALVVVMALLPAVGTAALVWLSPEGALRDWLADDAYYYLGTARNIAQGDGSTFGGLVPTNGYHPLWLLTLVPAFLAGLSGEGVTVAMLAAGCAAWGVVVAAGWSIARRLGMEAPFALSLPVAAYTMTFVFPGGMGLLFLGMETTLLLPLAAVLVRVAVHRELAEGRRQPAGVLLGVGALMAAILLARLDSVFFLGAFGLAVAAAGLRRRGPGAGLRDAALIAAPPAVALGLYVAVNLALFATATPVSGQAKALHGLVFNPSALAVVLFGTERLGDWAELKKLPGALLPGIVALALAARLRPPAGWDAGRCALALVAVALLVGQALHLAYLVFVSSWQIWDWYRYHAVLLLALALPLALDGAARAVRVRPAALAALLALAVVLAVALAGVRVERRLALGDNRGSYWVYAHDAAAELDRALPPDAVIAMGDLAGAIGFALDRPLVQTEGLMEGREYLERLSQPGGALRYLAERGVTHIAAADHRVRPLPADSGAPAGCGTITEPKSGSGPKLTLVVCEEDRVYRQRALTVWRYRPERQRP